MEKQEAKSRWDELARELGAVVAPEVVAPETEHDTEAASIPPENIEPPDVGPPESSPAPVPKRPAAGWDSLANEFGLLVPEQQPEPIAEHVATQAEPTRTVQPAASEKPKGDRRRPDRREDSKGYRRSRPRQAEDVGDKPEKITRPTVSASPAAPPPPPQEEPAKPPAVSLWHKIFGLPADQAARTSERPIIVDEAVTSSFEAEPAAREIGGSTPPLEVDVDDIETVTDTDRLDEVSTKDDEQGEAARKRPRRRRRGRGGRGRRSDADADAEQLDESDRRQSRKKKSEGEPGEFVKRSHELEDAEIDRDEIEATGRADDEELDEDDLGSDEHDDDEGEDGATPRVRSAMQRAIPSWEVAIGYIVEVNMQSRSQRRQSAYSSSRSSATRGRMRGRRKP